MLVSITSQYTLIIKTNPAKMFWCNCLMSNENSSRLCFCMLCWSYKHLFGPVCGQLPPSHPFCVPVILMLPTRDHQMKQHDFPYSCQASICFKNIFAIVHSWGTNKLRDQLIRLQRFWMPCSSRVAMGTDPLRHRPPERPSVMATFMQYCDPCHLYHQLSTLDNNRALKDQEQ